MLKARKRASARGCVAAARPCIKNPYGSFTGSSEAQAPKIRETTSNHLIPKESRSRLAAASLFPNAHAFRGQSKEICSFQNSSILVTSVIRGQRNKLPLTPPSCVDRFFSNPSTPKMIREAQKGAQDENFHLLSYLALPRGANGALRALKSRFRGQ